MPDQPAPGVTFGEVFDELRIRRGLSPAELARELGEPESSVSRWRRLGRTPRPGRGKGIDIRKIWKIADFFGVDRDYLAGLAGFPVSPLPSTEERSGDLDPAMVALLDAEHRYAHEELVGIPAVYHRTIIEAGIDAGSAARRRAAELARQFLAGQGISNPTGRGVSKPSKGRRNLNRGGDDGAANRLTTTLPAYAGV